MRGMPGISRPKPTRPRHVALALGLLAALVFLTSCGDSESDGAATSTTGSSATATDTSKAATGVDTDLFFEGALAEEVTTEDCTLSGGAQTTCYRITVAGYPVSHDVGPFCPSTITDSAAAGGIWFDGKAVYDLSGEFFVELATLYGDDNWRMYDEDGNILVTETADEFEAAARPDVDPALENHCVEGRLEWLDNGEPITTTVVIPTVPVLAGSPAAARGNLGVTLDGVVIAASAPVDAILGAYTIAAFDDCGAHFNPFEGYHMHGAVGCSEVGNAVEGETPMFGYAMDGYPVHSPIDPPTLRPLTSTRATDTQPTPPATTTTPTAPSRTRSSPA